jgi:hypothetical protein
MTVHCYGSSESLKVACAPDSPEILSLYSTCRGLDPALEGDYHQAIQAILCCPSITTTIPVISLRMKLRLLDMGSLFGLSISRSVMPSVS